MVLDRHEDESRGGGWRADWRELLVAGGARASTCQGVQQSADHDACGSEPGEWRKVSYHTLSSLLSVSIC